MTIVPGRVNQGAAGTTPWPVSIPAPPTIIEKQDQPASTTATWTSATALNAALTNTTVTGYGTANVSIQTPSTATAGAITIEVSDDGTVWYAAGAVRADNTLAENVVQLAGPGVAQNRMYAVSVDAMTHIRARLSTAIVGTGNTVVRIGLVAGGIEPLVATVPPRTMFALSASLPATVTTEALLSMVATRGLTAAAGATQQTVTAGKTLRITSLTAGLFASTAALVYGFLVLRARSSGTVVVTDPVMWRGRLSSNSALLGGAGWLSVSFPEGGLELPSGATFAVTHAANVTTGIWDISINGYEL